MACRADVICVSVVRRKLRVLLMVERCVTPTRRVVAVLACRREELWLCRVARIRRLLIIRLVAAVTIGGQRRVIAVHVAIGALPRRHGMRSSKGKSCVVVIKS